MSNYQLPGCLLPERLQIREVLIVVVVEQGVSGTRMLLIGLVDKAVDNKAVDNKSVDNKAFDQKGC